MTRKLSPDCLAFYNDVLWTCIGMAETGISMSQSQLESLEQELLQEASAAHAAASSLDVPLEGPGSTKAKTTFMDECVTTLRSSGHDPLPHLTLTEKRQEISFNSTNRHYLQTQFPPGSREHTVLSHSEVHSKSQKIVSSYTYPILRHRRNRPTDQSSVLIPAANHSPITLVYPTWYPTPAPVKDGAGASGGTQQGRITCKGPAVQTFPSPIKSCICSRFPSGCLLSFDLSQIELRVAALLSGEPSMVHFFQTGIGDLHTETATLVFDKPFEDITTGPHSERAQGKMINFWDLFLGGAATAHAACLADNYSVPISKFHELETNRHTRRPALFEWQKSLALSVERLGYQEIYPYGQSRFYVNFALDRHALARNLLRDRAGGGKHIHEIVNQPIQTTAGNVLLDIQTRLRRLLPGHRNPSILMTHQIYDAVYFDLRSPEHIPAAVAAIRCAVSECEHEGLWHRLQEHYGHRLPLAYDIEYPTGHEPG